jgi:hypothetical protein
MLVYTYTGQLNTTDVKPKGALWDNTILIRFPTSSIKKEAEPLFSLSLFPYPLTVYSQLRLLTANYTSFSFIEAINRQEEEKKNNIRVQSLHRNCSQTALQNLKKHSLKVKKKW